MVAVPATLGILGSLSVIVNSIHQRGSVFFYSCDSLLRTQPASTMSQVPPTSSSSTNFETIIAAALKVYNEQTKNDIALHPLATQLQSCDSPTAILAVLRTQVQSFNQTQSADEKWTKWLDPTVNVLYSFSATLGNGVGLVSCEM